MTEHPPLLEAQNVTVHFGGVTAVDHVNLKLTKTELRCIIGPNGAGKSTFFKTLTGQLRPNEGHIKLNGREITGHLPNQIARLGIGVKTQTPSVFDGLSVYENILVAAQRGRNSATAKHLVEMTMARLKLDHLAKSSVGKLAHGQRQWVEIATVLAQEPKLILLDEPAAGMTKDEIFFTAELIKDISRSQALIVVEHDMQFIRMIGSMVTVFNQGKILMEDSVDAVLADQRVRDVYIGKTLL